MKQYSHTNWNINRQWDRRIDRQTDTISKCLNRQQKGELKFNREKKKQKKIVDFLNKNVSLISVLYSKDICRQKLLSQS